MTPSLRTQTVTPLALLLPYLRPYWKRAALAAAMLALAAGLVVLLGQGLRNLVDTGLATGGTTGLDRAAMAMAGIVGVLAAATAVRFYNVSWLGERVGADLRQALFARVLQLSPTYYETARAGDVLTRLTADVALLSGLVGSALSQWLRSAAMLLGALAMLVTTSPRLALMVVLVAPLVVAPMVLSSRRERRQARAAQERLADLAAHAEETLGALRTVQAFTHEALDQDRFAALTGRSVAAAMDRVRTRTALVSGFIALGFGAVVLGLWIGGREVLAGRLTGGELSAFVFYAVVVASSGAGLSELWGEIRRASGAAERIGELLAQRPAIAAPAQPIALPEPPAGTVEFKDVSFHYPARPDRSALDGVSFRVDPGETVALVGPSGAGKSTVFQLLLRFYDPAAGAVLVDGVGLRDADPEQLRRRIGLVPQDPVLFGADAWTNIRYGRPGASDAEVRAAALAASAGFLDELPDGLGSFLGERGVRLSGGQRQRVAIARAVLRDPAILLLDEATSALDAESEAAVQAALAKLSHGRTTLVIAHRLATVRRADRILVLDEGRIVAEGRHEQLQRQGGLYARLAALQFGREAA